MNKEIEKEFDEEFRMFGYGGAEDDINDLQKSIKAFIDKHFVEKEVI